MKILTAAQFVEFISTAGFMTMNEVTRSRFCALFALYHSCDLLPCPAEEGEAKSAWKAGVDRQIERRLRLSQEEWDYTRKTLQAYDMLDDDYNVCTGEFPMYDARAAALEKRIIKMQQKRDASQKEKEVKKEVKNKLKEEGQSKEEAKAQNEPPQPQNETEAPQNELDEPPKKTQNEKTRTPANEGVCASVKSVKEEETAGGDGQNICAGLPQAQNAIATVLSASPPAV